MNLLNRMVTGGDLEGDVSKEQASQSEVAARLEKRGISPASAAKIVKVLENVMQDNDKADYERREPEPIAPEPADKSSIH